MERLILAYTGTDSLAGSVYAILAAAAVVLTIMHFLYF